jgi:hypothetical protein
MARIVIVPQCDETTHQLQQKAGPKLSFQRALLKKLRPRSLHAVSGLI